MQLTKIICQKMKITDVVTTSIHYSTTWSSSLPLCDVNSWYSMWNVLLLMWYSVFFCVALSINLKLKWTKTMVKNVTNSKSAQQVYIFLIHGIKYVWCMLLGGTSDMQTETSKIRTVCVCVCVCCLLYTSRCV